MNAILLRKLDDALADLDVGVPLSLLRSDPLRAINVVLREIGAPQIHDIEDESVERAIRAMERAG